MFVFSKRSIRNMKGVHPDLIKVAEEALRLSIIDFGIPNDGGLRTAERQNEMFLDPSIATQCDGYKNRSNHQIQDDGYGHSLDFYAFVQGKASWNQVHLAMIGALFTSVATRLLEEEKIQGTVEWGGTFGKRGKSFRGWDMPHVNYIPLGKTK